MCNKLHIFKVYNWINFNIYIHICIQVYIHIYTYIHTHEASTTIKIVNITILPKSSLVPLGDASLRPTPSPKLLIHFLSQWIHLHFLKFYVNRTIEYPQFLSGFPYLS